VLHEAPVYGFDVFLVFAGDEAQGVGGEVLELGFGEDGFKLF